MISPIPLMQGATKNELYEWSVSPSTTTSFFATTPPKLSTIDWHNRLGHFSLLILKTVVSNSFLPRFHYLFQNTLCINSSNNKSKKKSFSQTTLVSTSPLQYIFNDVWTSHVVSVDNFKYYLVLIDHYSRYTWLYPQEAKSKFEKSLCRSKHW